MASMGAAAPSTEGRKAFQYADKRLEVFFVEYLARRTLCQGVLLRSLLVLALVFSWRKATRSWPEQMSSRHFALQCLMACGIAAQVLSAVLLGQETQLWRHEVLKARRFIAIVILGMVTAIMHTVEEAERHLALPMHGLLVNGGGVLLFVLLPGPMHPQDQPLMTVFGQRKQQDPFSRYLLFEQVRWRSQVQLQCMQAIAFVMVAAGNYLDTGNRAALLTQLTVNLPSIVALQLFLGLLLEARARRDFLLKQEAPHEQLGSVWRRVLPLMGYTLPE